MIASLIFLYPKFAIRALLAFGTLDAHHETAVVFIQIRYAFVLLTGQIRMELAFAGQTVVFSACRTPIFGESSVEGEDCAATGSGTPTGIFHIVVHVVMEGKFFVFLS